LISMRAKAGKRLISLHQLRVQVAAVGAGCSQDGAFVTE
jgi:hypothetical protein